jgi:hypothetical protein
MTSKKEDTKKLPTSKVPNPSLLSDPFQDEKEAEDQPRKSTDKSGETKRPFVGMPKVRSTAGRSYQRRHTSAAVAEDSEKRPSISARDEYMQGLLQQMQSLEKSLAFSTSPTGSTSNSSITLLSDNAKPHVSPHWNRSLLMPSLDRYHPMDDFMVYLLRRNQIHARNVRLVRDNPHTHEKGSLAPLDIPWSPTSTTAREEDDSSSSLDVGGLSEYLRRRWVKSSEHSVTSTLTATTASLTSSGSTFAQQQEDSATSLDSSKLRLPSMKEDSPTKEQESNEETRD